MVFCDEYGCFGGDDDVELKEPWRNGLLLDILEGLVLLGLGPPAMLAFVRPLPFRLPEEPETRRLTGRSAEARREERKRR
jgi:hypothetical protein